MKPLFACLLINVVILLSMSCNSKKAVEKKETKENDGSIIGVYTHVSKGVGRKAIGKGDKSVLVLRKDSTAALDFTTFITGQLHYEGSFTFRNDSIFIIWSTTGGRIESKFEKGEGYYSFMNGITQFKREL